MLIHRLVKGPTHVPREDETNDALQIQVTSRSYYLRAAFILLGARDCAAKLFKGSDYSRTASNRRGMVLPSGCS